MLMSLSLSLSSVLLILVLQVILKLLTIGVRGIERLALPIGLEVMVNGD